MTSDAATCGANALGKAWALNENVEAARPHAKIEAIFIFAILTFLSWRLSVRVVFMLAYFGGFEPDCSLHHCDGGWPPTSVDDRRLDPTGADVERECSFGCR
jgi:hypothetical protein